MSTEMKTPKQKAERGPRGRGHRTDRQDRTVRQEQPGRPEGADRPEGAARQERSGRNDRSGRPGRQDRGSRYDRNARAERQDRAARERNEAERVLAAEAAGAARTELTGHAEPAAGDRNDASERSVRAAREREVEQVELSGRFDWLLKERKLTLAKLSEITGVSTLALEYVTKREYAPTSHVALKIAKALGVKTTHLWPRA